MERFLSCMNFSLRKGGASGALLLFCTIALLLCGSAALSYAFTLPDSDQRKCYDSAGSEISCTGTGQDGAYIINPLSYTDNGNGTVTDNNTGLMWQKCSVGQYNNDSCSGSASTWNWYQASGTYHATYNFAGQNACVGVNLGGHADWRLPAKKELMSIVDYGTLYPRPTIYAAYFPNTKLSYYWSSTTYVRYPLHAWSVFFSGGSVYENFKGSGSGYVRCVRGGQSS